MKKHAASTTTASDLIQISLRIMTGEQGYAVFDRTEFAFTGAKAKDFSATGQGRRIPPRSCRVGGVASCALEPVLPVVRVVLAIRQAPFRNSPTVGPWRTRRSKKSHCQIS